MNRREIVQRFLDAGLLVHPNVVSYIAESRNPEKLIDDIIRVCPPCGFPVTMHDVRDLHRRNLQAVAVRLLGAGTEERIEKLRALERSSPFEGERRSAKRKADELEKRFTD